MKPLQLSPETAIKKAQKIKCTTRTAYAYATTYSHSKINGNEKEKRTMNK